MFFVNAIPLLPSGILKGTARTTLRLKSILVVRRADQKKRLWCVQRLGAGGVSASGLGVTRKKLQTWQRIVGACSCPQRTASPEHACNVLHHCIIHHLHHFLLGLHRRGCQYKRLDFLVRVPTRDFFPLGCPGRNNLAHTRSAFCVKLAAELKWQVAWRVRKFV